MARLARTDRVSGQYHGVSVAGQVSSLRSHTMNWNLMIVDVALDKPVSVFGRERTDVQLWVTEATLRADDGHCCLTREA